MKLSTNNFLSQIKGLVTGGGRRTDGRPQLDAGFAKRASGVSLASFCPTAVGAGMYTLSIPFNLASIADGDLVTTYVVGHRFKIIKFDWVTTTVASTAAKASTINLEIGTTDVTGGVISLTTASCDALGEKTTGTAITAANTGNATDTISIEAASTTAFIEGSGAFLIQIQNLDAVEAIAGAADETNARVLMVEEAVDDIGRVVWTVPRDYDEATDILRFRVLASMVSVSTDDDVELDAKVYVKRAGVALTADKNPTAPGTILSTTEQWLEFDLKGYSLQRDDIVTINLITNGANDTSGEEVLIHDVELVYRSCLVSYDRDSDAEGNPLR